MEYTRPKLILPGGSGVEEFDILSLDEFREKRGIHDLSNQSIDNHFKRGTLDFVTIGRFRYVVWNDKAKRFTLVYSKPVQG